MRTTAETSLRWSIALSRRAIFPHRMPWGASSAYIATMGGNEVSLDLRTVMAKRLMITGSTLRPRSVGEKRRLRDGVEEHFWPLIRKGRIRPVVDQEFSMGDVARAHERMESSLHIGKIVLKVA